VPPPLAPLPDPPPAPPPQPNSVPAATRITPKKARDVNNGVKKASWALMSVVYESFAFLRIA
jgi:hypothetical protein